MKLKVLSYNIHKGFNLWGAELTLHKIKQALRETGADLLFLQEVVGENHQWSRNYSNYPAQAQFEFLADEVWPHYAYGKNAVFPTRNHGNAILSRYPIQSFENYNLSLHKWESRGLLFAEIYIPEIKKTLNTATTHINLRESDRAKQVAHICEILSKRVSPDKDLILTGDFNDWMRKVSTPLRERLSLQEAHFLQYGHYGSTFPSVYPFLKLDRIYSRHHRVNHAEILKDSPWANLSDHLPLLVEFDLKKD
ncbi:MAG: endonuclease/exonuclease/phosphatase family protein [Proteobacteria bacterium]|jgi:endonuclease/exonuclease/phosphatase family metal-dependent hydrolase|nr:endonuclease/exonuclease/phosphatase family protein [Pseudomonadota bacterium]